MSTCCGVSETWYFYFFSRRFYLIQQQTPVHKAARQATPTKMAKVTIAAI